MPLDPVAYLPYADPDDFIREVTDLIWVRRSVGYIRQNYEDDSIVHGPFGTAIGFDHVIEGTLMRIADTPNRVGQAEDVIWEGRGDDAFVSSHIALGTDLQNIEFRSRNIAHCLYRRGRMVEEWVVRDSLAAARQLGRDPDELARQKAFVGYAGSMLEPPPSDVLAVGDSGPRPDDHRAEADLVLEFIDIVWNQRLLERVEQYCVRDVWLHTVDDRTIARPEGYRRALLRFLQAFPGGRFDVRDIATHHAERYAGTRVAVVWVFKGVHDGADSYGALTGAAVQVIGISHFLVQSGRITREIMVYDDVGIRAQIIAARGDHDYVSTNLY